MLDEQPQPEREEEHPPVALDGVVAVPPTKFLEITTAASSGSDSVDVMLIGPGRVDWAR
jgi:hypothetical protein